jgi:hypothetical protein
MDPSMPMQESQQASTDDDGTDDDEDLDSEERAMMAEGLELLHERGRLQNKLKEASEIEKQRNALLLL